MEKSKPVAKHFGIIKAHNYSPKGDVDGLLIEGDGGHALVNFPPHAWDALAARAGVGQPIELEVEPEPAVDKHGKGEVAAHKMANVEPPRPKDKDKGHGHDGKHEHEHHDDKKKEHGEPSAVEGVVARVNYAHHGEANGVVLESGDFVHMKPEGMKLAGLKVGDKVQAEGDARPMPGKGNGKVVEARVVNGTAIKK